MDLGFKRISTCNTGNRLIGNMIRLTSHFFKLGTSHVFTTEKQPCTFKKVFCINHQPPTPFKVFNPAGLASIHNVKTPRYDKDRTFTPQGV